jgi:DNA modification methylase
MEGIMSITFKKKLDDYIITPAETSVIFRDNMDQPVHRWFLYTEGFSNEFVNYYFDKYNITDKHIVYEPFMGSGTVGLCSKFRNIDCLGVELNPLMYFISKVKNNFELYSIEKIIELKHSIEFPKEPSLNPPTFLKNDKHFLPEILQEILKIKEAVYSLPDIPEKDIFKLAFANILLRSSNAKRVPSFGYKPKKNLSVDLPYKLFEESLYTIISDIKNNQNKTLGKVTIINGDSREQHFGSESADIAITSPPYANGIDYVTDYQLEMGWLDLINDEDKKKLRDGMIAYDKTRSIVLREFYNRNEFYREENLMNVISKLEEISSDYWKKDIHLVLLKYFDDMYKVFQSTYKILKKGSRFILVVGDSLFQNVYVPADLLLGIMGEQLGFEFESIQIARTRYSGQNRSFKLRETIITLKKV